jgi:hypothetical protein
MYLAMAPLWQSTLAVSPHTVYVPEPLMARFDLKALA